MNWLSYHYTKQRREFGRQCLFAEKKQVLYEPIRSEYGLIKDYILKNPVDRGTQLGTQMAVSDCNTEPKTFASRGMSHTEGGWPKDINFKDEEQAVRYKKKLQREDSWARELLLLTKPIEHALYQNSAINIYEEYFTDFRTLKLPKDFNAYVVNRYNDTFISTRSIRNITWHPMDDRFFLATYGVLELYSLSRLHPVSYIWDVDNPNQPATHVKSLKRATIIEWCPKDPNLIAGGLETGEVVTWGYLPEPEISYSSVTPLEITHRESVSCLCFVHSKSNSEFYTGSLGGFIQYWDARNLSDPIFSILLDPERTNEQSYGRCHGCTVLEFEYTIPVRYLVGTDRGHIFLGNRKGLTPMETWAGHFQVMNGPVRAISRNPFFVKNFLVVGDWCTKIWTEECKDYPLYRTRRHKSEVNCGTWSEGRCSLFFTGMEDGSVEFWDILLDQQNPLYTMHFFKSPITALKSSPKGDFLLVGTEAGDIHAVELDKPLTTSSQKERALISAFFERETRRIKLLETRIREVKLKMAKEEEELRRSTIAEEQEMMDEEMLEEQEGDIISGDLEPSTVSHSGEEEGAPEEEDPELVEARNMYFSVVSEEEERRKDNKKTLLTITAFDPNFIVETNLKMKYPLETKVDFIDQEGEHWNELKRIIDERRANRKSVYLGARGTEMEEGRGFGGKMTQSEADFANRTKEPMKSRSDEKVQKAKKSISEYDMAEEQRESEYKDDEGEERMSTEARQSEEE